MTIRVPRGAAATVALLMLVLAGCNGSSTTSSTPATPVPALANVAGQFRGTVDDTAFGSGKSLGDFSQTGATVGGRLRLKYGNKTVVNSVAMTLSHSSALSGSAVATIASAACTFNVSATYDTTTFVLAGTYTAAAGCDGESGSFSMHEICSYQQGQASPRDRRRSQPDAGGLHGC